MKIGLYQKKEYKPHCNSLLKGEEIFQVIRD